MSGPRVRAPAGPSFPLRHRLFRALWGVAWMVLALWTPPFCHRWRRLVLCAFGARVARGARVHASVRVWYPPNLMIGRDALVGPGAQLYNQAPIAIGADAVVSQRAHLCTGSHDIADPGFALVARAIRVGESAWVAAEAFVGPGVIVGDGAVVGARAVLFRDARPWGVYLGNPARFARVRQLRYADASGSASG